MWRVLLEICSCFVLAIDESGEPDIFFPCPAFGSPLEDDFYLDFDWREKPLEKKRENTKRGKSTKVS